MSAGADVALLEARIRELVAMTEPPRDAAREAVDALLAELESGRARAARPVDGDWVVDDWVKLGILRAFRVGENVAFGGAGAFAFRDRDTMATWSPEVADRNVRIVPGGTTVRRGAHLADGVVVMPPAYVNVGAFVGAGSMIDSHALVGSCAQVGERVHLSAAAQIGGVLEPIGALPVIVEDDAFIGGNCGIYEGVRVGSGAVLASGVILAASLPLYDLVHDRLIRAEEGRPLVVPPRAVVVPGSRPASGATAERLGLQLQCPIIVKYRDEGTAASTALESALR